MTVCSQRYWLVLAAPVESQLHHMAERFQSSGFAIGCRLPEIDCVKTFVQFMEEQRGPRLTSDLKWTGQAGGPSSCLSAQPFSKGWSLIAG